MTNAELDEIEEMYLKHSNTAAGKRILKLVEYCRDLKEENKKLLNNEDI